VLKLQSFLPNHSPKMRERYQLFFRLRLASKKFRNPNQKRAALWRIFHQMKVRQPANMKIGFYADYDPNKQEVGFIFASSGSEL
jgi:hypothetical protein